MSIMSQEAKKQLGCVLHWSGGSSSSNAPKQITSYGDVKQILPFPGAGIGMFDGTGDYLSIPDSDDWYFGNDNFCIEMLVNQPSSASCALIAQAPEEVNRWVLYTNTDNTARFYIKYLNSTIGEAVSPANFTFNVWHHVAVIGIAGTIYVAVDGVLGTGVTMSSPQIVGALTIGTQAYGGTLLNGNISELRITKGIARYTSNFTPPRRQLESDEHTKLLIHFNRNDTTFIDSSPSAHTITQYGDAKQLCSPCGSGVAYFDGTGDYMTCGNASDWSFLSNDVWTLELWFYIISNANGAKFIDNRSIYSTILFFARADLKIGYQFSNASNAWINPSSNNYGSNNYVLNAWNHVVVTRTGMNTSAVIKGYLNGVLDFTYNIGSTVLATPNIPLNIGRYVYDSTGYFTGYISDLRISNCTRYTSDFTPSTQPFRPDPYTKLLLHMDGVGAAFYDSSDPPGDNGFPILPDGVTVTPSGTFTTHKMKDGRNIWKFDGSTNYITISDHASWSMFLNDFTIAGWVKFDSIAANKVIIGQYADANNQWYLQWTTSNIIQLYGITSSTARFDFSCPLAAVANTWYHIVVQRSGSSCIMYINGVAQTVTQTTAFSATATDIAAVLSIGKINTGYQTGNIKDLQMFTKALTQDQIAAIMRETYIY